MDHQIQYPGNMAEGTLMPQNDAVKLTPELIDSFEAYMKIREWIRAPLKATDRLWRCCISGCRKRK